MGTPPAGIPPPNATKQAKTVAERRVEDPGIYLRLQIRRGAVASKIGRLGLVQQPSCNHAGR